MEMRPLGATGIEISVVGYGAWEAGGSEWGERTEDDVIVDAMLAAADAGMNWIDTAEAYGDGHSEELVGRALRARPEMLVFSKVAPFATGTRPEQVKRAIRGSLKRLGVDHVDLYQVHWPDEENVPVEDTWGAMAELVDEGLTRAIGVSNFDRGLVERCAPIRRVDAVQNQFSLLHRDDAAELLPWLADQNIAYLAYGPLAFGLLTGKITADTRFDDDDWRSGAGSFGYYRELFAPGKIEESLARVGRLRAIAERLGVELSELALRAAIDTPGVSGVIAGSRNPRHVKQNAAAGDLALDAPDLDEIIRAVGD